MIPLDDEDQTNDHDVDSRRKVDRFPDSQPGEEEKGGTECADNSSQSVNAVEDAHSPAQPLESLDDEPGNDGQSAAHQKAGDKEDRERQEQPGEAWEKRCDGKTSIETNVDDRHRRNDDRRQDGEYPNACLQTGVESEWVSGPVGNAAEVEAAGCHSTEKGSYDGGRGVSGVSKHQDEHPLPDNLIDQPGSAGKEEEYQQEKLSTA